METVVDMLLNVFSVRGFCGKE